MHAYISRVTPTHALTCTGWFHTWSYHTIACPSVWTGTCTIAVAPPTCTEKIVLTFQIFVYFCINYTCSETPLAAMHLCMGNNIFSRYRGGLYETLFWTKFSLIWDLGAWPLYRMHAIAWPLFRGGRYEGFHGIHTKSPDELLSKLITPTGKIPPCMVQISIACVECSGQVIHPPTHSPALVESAVCHVAP